MAEPLSIVLAGVALATAIKDVMEVWDKIEASFARVSQNLRAAQQLVGDIRTTLDHLSEFCEEHHAILDKSEKTRLALVNLVRKMNAVHATCSRLIPPVSEKTFEKYKLKYYIWKNGRKIEGEIMDLRRHIDSCLTLFSVFTAIRTETRLIEFQDISLERSTGILNVLSELGVSDKRVHTFSRHNTTIPPTPSLDSTVADTYLTFQIEVLYDRIWYLCATSESSETELCRVLEAQPVDPTLRLEDYTTRNRESLHGNAVRSTLEMQYLLTLRAEPLSVETGRVLLTKLAQMLHALGMISYCVRLIGCMGYLNSRYIKIMSDLDDEDSGQMKEMDEEDAEAAIRAYEPLFRELWEWLHDNFYHWHAMGPKPYQTNYIIM